jgi:hypothetical protein
MRWVAHVALMGQMRNAYKFWSVNLKERDYSEDIFIHWRIILKRTSGKQIEKVWTGFIWLRNQWQALENKAMNIRVP